MPRIPKAAQRTPAEQEVLDHLVKAWNAWIKLEHKHPQAQGEFCQAIHTCQYLIGMRQIARIDKTWSPR